MQTVADIMTPDVATVGPQDPVQRVAQLLKDLDIGSVPVCDDGRLIGMITDRDITTRAVAEGGADNMQARDVMTVSIKSCYADQAVDELMEQMRGEQIRRVPVLDRNTQQVIGIVSLGDLATKHSAEVDRTLADISTPSEPER